MRPFAGVGATRPEGRMAAPPVRTCAAYPSNGDKTTADLRAALQNAGLRDGMVVSTHHHLRDGDYVAAMLFAAAESMGVKDLVWFPSAVFPCHAELLRYLENGTIHHIEGSLNGPVGDYASRGKMRGQAVLRSHGSRYRAIQDGDVKVDIAVIAAPSADPFGNLRGTDGPSACGGLGFAVADARYADHVIAVTDHLVPFPCAPWQIEGNYVDQVVVVDRIGDASRIVSGTTELTRSPERLLIAEYAARFGAEAGILKDGWSFQAGAGGISLAFTLFARDLMRERGVKAAFVRGGSTRYLVEMLETGLTGYILDGQTFDLEGVRSMRENPRHLMTTPFNSYNYHGKGHFASLLDCAVLGATEVDLDFNANVVSHSDGRMLHGIGGWQDALFSKCTILAVPTFRNRVPIIRDRLTTLCGPGELVDVVATERGIAINPRRPDLLAAVKGSDLPIRTLESLKAEAEALCGGPPEPFALDGPVVGLVTWVDGTLLDTLRQVP
ncbi:citrate lyase subunit alpha [soil metagenome]